MIILKEQELNEMALRVMGSLDDGLPFKVIIKSPDKGKFDHARIIKPGTKTTELGAFVIAKNPPQSITDLVGYTEGKYEGIKNFNSDQLQLLVNWASSQSPLLPAYTNWQMLQYEYAVNRRS
jgi:hypothetical protein